MVNGSITNGICQFTVQKTGIVGSTPGPTQLVSFPFTIPACSFIQEFSGTFTPHDNYQYIVQVPNCVAASINFVYIVTSGYTLITQIYSGGSIVMGSAGLFMLQPSPSSSNVLSQIYIDGRVGPNPSGGYAPMAQGTPINYYGIVANAIVGGI